MRPRRKSGRALPYQSTHEAAQSCDEHADIVAALRQSPSAVLVADGDAALPALLAAAIPARRLASPHDVAFAVAFLAAPVGGYINGINLPVDGGRTGAL